MVGFYVFMARLAKAMCTVCIWCQEVAHLRLKWSEEHWAPVFQTWVRRWIPSPQYPGNRLWYTD